MVGTLAADPLEKPASGKIPGMEIVGEVETWLKMSLEKREGAEPKGAVTKDAVNGITAMVFAALKEEAAAERKDELKRRDATEDGAITFGVVKAAGKEMKKQGLVRK